MNFDAFRTYFIIYVTLALNLIFNNISCFSPFDNSIHPPIYTTNTGSCERAYGHAGAQVNTTTAINKKRRMHLRGEVRLAVGGRRAHGRSIVSLHFMLDRILSLTDTMQFQVTKKNFRRRLDTFHTKIDEIDSNVSLAPKIYIVPILTIKKMHERNSDFWWAQKA